MARPDDEPSNATLASDVAPSRRGAGRGRRGGTCRYRIAPAGGDGKRACSAMSSQAIDMQAEGTPPSHATGGAKAAHGAWRTYSLQDIDVAYARYALAAYDLDASWFGNERDGLLGFSPGGQHGDPRRGGGRLKDTIFLWHDLQSSAWRGAFESTRRRNLQAAGACNDARHGRMERPGGAVPAQERGSSCSIRQRGVCHECE